MACFYHTISPHVRHSGGTQTLPHLQSKQPIKLDLMEWQLEENRVTALESEVWSTCYISEASSVKLSLFFTISQFLLYILYLIFLNIKKKWFDVQETFLIISVENSCGVCLFFFQHFWWVEQLLFVIFIYLFIIIIIIYFFLPNLCALVE